MRSFNLQIGQLPERKLKPAVYDNYIEAQKGLTEVFKCSSVDAKTPEDIAEFQLENMLNLKPLRIPVDPELYKGVKVYDKDLADVGCGIIATYQAMIPLGYQHTREQIVELTNVIEQKGYYYDGRGLYWHWFNNFAKRVTHWYEIVSSVSDGHVVTVLIHRPDDERNYFMNILGTAPCEESISSETFKFITSDDSRNNEISLKQLMEEIVTAPWVWLN